MSPGKHFKNYSHLLLPSLIIIGVSWSLGLLGVGLWQQVQQPQTRSANPTDETLGYSTFTQVKNVPAGRFRYSGSPSWSPIRLVVDSAIQAERRELQLSFIQPIDKSANTASAIDRLMFGQLDFVQSDRPLNSLEVAQAQQRGLQLKQTPVAIDGIAIAVHPSLSIQGLNLEQVADIYRGKITNWEQVGGPNLEIQPFSLSLASMGTLDLFLNKVMQGNPFGSQLSYFPNVTTALRRLAESPGGIFFGSAAEIVPQCSVKALPLGEGLQQWISPYLPPYIPPQQCPNQRNQLNTPVFSNQRYPLTHKLYVIYAENDRRSQGGEAYTQLLISNQGQNLLRKAGYVRIVQDSQSE